MYSYEVRKLVGCTCLDYVRLDDYIMVYCDDDGLTDGLEACTKINVSGTALAGNLLVVGLNEEGELTFPKPTIEEMADRFTVIRPVMDPIFEQLTGPHVFGCKLTGFELRLLSARPIIE